MSVTSYRPRETPCDIRRDSARTSSNKVKSLWDVQTEFLQTAYEHGAKTPFKRKEANSANFELKCVCPWKGEQNEEEEKSDDDDDEDEGKDQYDFITTTATTIIIIIIIIIIIVIFATTTTTTAATTTTTTTFDYARW